MPCLPHEIADMAFNRHEKSALGSRQTVAPEQPESPPELTPKQRALQEDMEALDEARSKLLGAHEILSAYGFNDWAVDVWAIASTLSGEINDLEWKINESTR